MTKQEYADENVHALMGLVIDAVHTQRSGPVMSKFYEMQMAKLRALLYELYDLAMVQAKADLAMLQAKPASNGAPANSPQQEKPSYDRQTTPQANRRQ
jgi:hypothetical protein